MWLQIKGKKVFETAPNAKFFLNTHSWFAVYSLVERANKNIKQKIKHKLLNFLECSGVIYLVCKSGKVSLRNCN